MTENTVQLNAGGGVLLSDDTGPTHHNLVSFNTVTDDAGACGLTMASHIPPNATEGQWRVHQHSFPWLTLGVPSSTNY